MTIWSSILDRFRRARRASLLRRAARRELDALFAERPELLSQARLARHHRNRLVLLEIDPVTPASDADRSERIDRLLIGIVRHPKSHPLAGRGEEVLELIEYRPAEGTLRNVGSRNLTRRPVDG